jgi:tRNA (guanosine-2'-O-)-methyltransferase
MRSADAFGVQDVHVVPGPHGFQAAHRVAKGTHRWLDVIRHASAEACVTALHAAGYEVLVAAMEGAIPAETLAARPRVALVFGNEHRGASEALRSGADGTFAVPMRGFVESLNVSVAAAVTLHVATSGRSGDIGADAREELLARWLMADVRDAERVVRERRFEGT